MSTYEIVYMHTAVVVMSSVEHSILDNSPSPRASACVIHGLHKCKNNLITCRKFEHVFQEVLVNLWLELWEKELYNRVTDVEEFILGNYPNLISVISTIPTLTDKVEDYVEPRADGYTTH